VRFAARTFLELLVAEKYPEQEPAWQSARWYHLFWLAVPMIGVPLFVDAVRSAHVRRRCVEHDRAYTSIDHK
jgi:hypothetical protein